MMNDDLGSLERHLVRIVETENAAFLDRYSYLGDVNMEFSERTTPGLEAVSISV